MPYLIHLALFSGATIVLWLLSGILIEATNRVAHRYQKPGFAVAFFVLGFLTSISEISVAVNSTFEGVPQISAGNLVGASLVLFLLLIPLLAVVGHGIPLNGVLTSSVMILLLFTVFLPSILLIDGDLTRREGLLLIALYIALVYWVQRRFPRPRARQSTMKKVEQELVHRRQTTAVDIVKILLAGVLIFVAGSVLVDESIYFSMLFGAPPSLIGLMLLAIGTNIPEGVIAIRCVTGHHKDIAFGDYMGSAAANVPLLGFLALANGTFAIEPHEFMTTGVFLGVGLLLFFFFARSGREFSRREGIALLCLYVLFIIMQLTVFAVGAPEPDLLHAALPR